MNLFKINVHVFILRILRHHLLTIPRRSSDRGNGHTNGERLLFILFCFLNNTDAFIASFHPFDSLEEHPWISNTHAYSFKSDSHVDRSMERCRSYPCFGQVCQS